MARHIDADKFAERIKASPAFRNIYDGLLLQRVVIDLLNNAPTADVVPRSEYDELLKAYSVYEEITGLKQVKTDVAREIFAEIEKMISNSVIREDDGGAYITISLLHEVTYLKKKYTEEQI